METPSQATESKELVEQVELKALDMVVVFRLVGMGSLLVEVVVVEFADSSAVEA